MAESKFYEKCKNADFERILTEKGYKYFTKGAYNLNIIGVRSDQQGKVTNLYDDLLVVIYRTPKSEEFTRKIYKITTEPGTYYMVKRLIIEKGTSILAPGQYPSSHAVGKHKKKYKALVQVGNLTVYRDNNKDMKYDLKPSKKYTGLFGINIHRSDEFATTKTIDNYSAGCQVFADPKEFDSFMYLCDKQNENFKKNRFTYTLLNESDLIYFLTDKDDKEDK